VGPRGRAVLRPWSCSPRRRAGALLDEPRPADGAPSSLPSPSAPPPASARPPAPPSSTGRQAHEPRLHLPRARYKVDRLRVAKSTRSTAASPSRHGRSGTVRLHRPREARGEPVGRARRRPTALGRHALPLLTGLHSPLLDGPLRRRPSEILSSTSTRRSRTPASPPPPPRRGTPILAELVKWCMEQDPRLRPHYSVLSPHAHPRIHRPPYRGPDSRGSPQALPFDPCPPAERSSPMRRAAPLVRGRLALRSRFSPP
jgi:hypothetical protein